LLRRLDPAVLAGLIVVWAAAWSAPHGQIVTDTKYDLVLDPWGFLGRALSVWDSQQNWGGLANQAHGYLFPMGPFFGVFGEVLPAWAVQRLWWTALLTAGFVGAYGLMRSLGLLGKLAVMGALAWVLAPKVVSSFAVLSGEIHPHLLIPLILWPVVAGWRGRLTPWAASLLSGGAIVLAGGVNGAAVLLAIVPTGLFLVTRSRWWRSPLTWTWALVTVLATAWWLGPLFFMARYSAPFLDWIENSAAVSAQVGLLDVFRGTTQWLGHLLTTAGPWWPGGYELATSPWLIVLTTILTALGLCGLTLRSVPLRGYLWTLLLIGLVAMSLPHAGALSSPLMTATQDVLDGPLAAFRNIHKADGLVRLPLVIGLVHLTGVLSSRIPEPALAMPRRARGVALGVIALVVVGSAAPAFTGAAVARGGHPEVPEYWVEAGAWLDEHNPDAASLIVPAANFAEYQWGRTLDEPLRSLTSTDIVVRDAIPLVNAGSIRLLDEVDRRLQGGRGLGGAAAVLSDAGVRYLIVRNDLATDQAGQPPVVLARAAVRNSEGVRFVKGFGGTIVDLSGEGIHPVEIYELPGRVSTPLTLWPGSAAVTASGFTEDLPRLAEAGLGDRPVIFTADRRGVAATGAVVLTDGLRARETFFGAPRGADSSTTLTATRAAEVRDYRPASDQGLLTSITYAGIRDVTASSSIAERVTFAGLNPAMRPFAAIDPRDESGWLTMWDPEPTIAIDLTAPTGLDHVVITPWTDDLPGTAAVAVATEVRVSTEVGSVVADLGTEPTRIELPHGSTDRVEITITETSAGPPANQLTGLATIDIPGIRPIERVTVPSVGDGRTPSAIVLSGGRGGFDGCFYGDDGMRCLGSSSVLPESVAGADYLLEEAAAGAWSMSGTMVGSGELGVVGGSPDVEISASSSRSTAPLAAPDSLIDSDRRTAWSPAFDDPSPELDLQFPQPVEITDVSLRVRDGGVPPGGVLARLRLGGQEFLRTLPQNGRLSIPSTRAERLVVEFVPTDRATILAGLELTEVVINGRPFAPPPQEWHAACGEGPSVSVNGEPVDTEATITRRGALGLDEITWGACDLVTLAGIEDEIRVGPWHGFAPGATRLLPRQPVNSVPAPTSLDVDREGDALRATLPPSAEDRLLVLTQNANAGWRADIEGSALEDQVVDGRRQAFLVPAGISGEVRIAFGPERFYRPVIVVGLVLALGVLLAAAWHASRLTRGALASPAPMDAPAPVTRHSVQRGVPLAAVVAAMLVAGPVGGLAAGAGWLASVRVGLRVALALVAGLVVGSAIAQGVVAPASVGPPWLEGGIRVALLMALGVASAGAASGDQPRDRQFQELVAEEA